MSIQNKRRQRSALLMLMGLVPLLSGCAPAIIAGAGLGASAAHDRRTTGTLVEDQAIELKILKRISDDDELSDQAHYNAVSFNAVVLITGEVPMEELRDRITQIVSGIPKVRKVHNEMEIAAPSALLSRTNDTVLTGKAKAKMLAEKNLDVTRIKVLTERGVVYLMGLVTRQEGEIATELTRTVGGVNKVVRLFEYTDQ